MDSSINLIAKLDYPSPAVMLISTALMVAFIWGGGSWLKRVDERSKAERAALKAKLEATAVEPKSEVNVQV